MKRLLFSFLFVLTAIGGWAQEPFTVGNFSYVETDAENHYVSVAQNSENAPSGAVVIPSSVTHDAVTYTVTSIAASAFYGPEITSVTIPASVLTIGDEAFQNCYSLTSITIEDSETPLTMPGTWYERPLWSPATTIYIGRDLTLTGGENNPLTHDATSVEFGPQVTTINPALFYSNSHLASITIGSGVTTIGESAFYSCGHDEGVTETVVSMGSNVTSIGANAFRDNPKLKSITLPSKLTTIGNNAFNASGLTSISIPASVMTIGNEAFQGCNSMTSITIADSETPLTMPGTFYQRPFWNDATTIYIGRNLTLTGGENNPLLYGATSVEFGPKVTTINPALFYSNTNLASITIGSCVTTIGDGAFQSSGTYWDEENNQGVEELVVTMGDNVTSIGVNAFRDCTKLKSIPLSSKLASIGDGAFYNCSALTSITIPASVTSVGVAAFQDCSSMTSIRIEDSGTALTMAGTYYERPFWNPAATIYIGRNLTLTGEGDIASLNDAATSVEFGSPVTAISAPISGVLTSVKVPWLTPITIDEGIFNDTELENATLWVPGGTMDDYKAADGWKDFTNVDHWSTLVTLTASTHGSIVTAEATANNGTEQYRQPKNDDIVYTLNADTGYELTALTDNAAAVSPLPALGEAQTRTNTSGEEFVTLNATFSAISYTLGYELAGGTVASANPTSYTIESAAITLNNPTREGYTFAGWTGTGLDAATTTVTIAAGSTGNRSYTATWTPIIYNIEYTMDDGTATPANPTTYTIETPTFTLTNPTKTGYTFAGWTGTDLDAATTEVTIAAGSTGNRSYTATWQVNQYTITFNSNGGSAVDPITQNYGTTVTPPADPTRTGYDFDGWSPAVPATMPAENMTVVAQWTLATYAVTITGGGVTADITTPKYGDDVVLTIMNDPDATLTSLKVNGTEVKESIADNQYTIENVSGDINVVATWSSTKEFITLGSDIATFSCTQDLNFTGSELKAYIAAGFNKDGSGTVLLVRVYDVPANTGLVIKGTQEDTYKIPYSTSMSYFVNMLKAHTTDEAVPVTEGDYTNFILQKPGDDYIWNHGKEGTMSLGAKKAYLQLPTSFVSSSAREMHMVFEDELTPTEIRDNYILLQESKYNGRIYNVSGQQIETLQKGVNIVNGRKILK